MPPKKKAPQPTKKSVISSSVKEDSAPPVQETTKTRTKNNTDSVLSDLFGDNQIIEFNEDGEMIAIPSSSQKKESGRNNNRNFVIMNDASKNGNDLLEEDDEEGEMSNQLILTSKVNIQQIPVLNVASPSKKNEEAVLSNNATPMRTQVLPTGNTKNNNTNVGSSSTSSNFLQPPIQQFHRPNNNNSSSNLNISKSNLGQFQPRQQNPSSNNTNNAGSYNPNAFLMNNNNNAPENSYNNNNSATNNYKTMMTVNPFISAASAPNKNNTNSMSSSSSSYLAGIGSSSSLAYFNSPGRTSITNNNSSGSGSMLTINKNNNDDDIFQAPLQNNKNSNRKIINPQSHFHDDSNNNNAKQGASNHHHHHHHHHHEDDEPQISIPSHHHHHHHRHNNNSNPINHQDADGFSSPDFSMASKMGTNKDNSTRRQQQPRLQQQQQQQQRNSGGVVNTNNANNFSRAPSVRSPSVAPACPRKSAAGGGGNNANHVPWIPTTSQARAASQAGLAGLGGESFILTTTTGGGRGSPMRSGGGIQLTQPLLPTPQSSRLSFSHQQNQNHNFLMAPPMMMSTYGGKYHGSSHHNNNVSTTNNSSGSLLQVPPLLPTPNAGGNNNNNNNNTNNNAILSNFHSKNSIADNSNNMMMMMSATRSSTASSSFASPEPERQSNKIASNTNNNNNPSLHVHFAANNNNNNASRIIQNQKNNKVQFGPDSNMRRKFSSYEVVDVDLEDDEVGNNNNTNNRMGAKSKSSKSSFYGQTSSSSSSDDEDEKDPKKVNRLKNFNNVSKNTFVATNYGRGSSLPMNFAGIPVTKENNNINNSFLIKDDSASLLTQALFSSNNNNNNITAAAAASESSSEINQAFWKQERQRRFGSGKAPRVVDNGTQLSNSQNFDNSRFFQSTSVMNNSNQPPSSYSSPQASTSARASNKSNLNNNNNQVTDGSKTPLLLLSPTKRPHNNYSSGKSGNLFNQQQQQLSVVRTNRSNNAANTEQTPNRQVMNTQLLQAIGVGGSAIQSNQLGQNFRKTAGGGLSSSSDQRNKKIFVEDETGRFVEVTDDDDRQPQPNSNYYENLPKIVIVDVDDEDVNEIGSRVVVGVDAAELSNSKIGKNMSTEEEHLLSQKVFLEYSTVPSTSATAEKKNKVELNDDEAKTGNLDDEHEQLLVADDDEDELANLSTDKAVASSSERRRHDEERISQQHQPLPTAAEVLLPLFPLKFTKRGFLRDARLVVGDANCVAPGQFWEHFSKFRFLGEGSFGFVWKCEAGDYSGLEVAVKACPLSFHCKEAIDDNYSILREIATLKLIEKYQIPGVLPLYGAFFSIGAEALPPPILEKAELQEVRASEGHPSNDEGDDHQNDDDDEDSNVPTVCPSEVGEDAAEVLSSRASSSAGSVAANKEDLELLADDDDDDGDDDTLLNSLLEDEYLLEDPEKYTIIKQMDLDHETQTKQKFDVECQQIEADISVLQTHLQEIRQHEKKNNVEFYSDDKIETWLEAKAEAKRQKQENRELAEIILSQGNNNNNNSSGTLRLDSASDDDDDEENVPPSRRSPASKKAAPKPKPKPKAKAKGKVAKFSKKDETVESCESDNDDVDDDEKEENKNRVRKGAGPKTTNTINNNNNNSSRMPPPMKPCPKPLGKTLAGAALKKYKERVEREEAEYQEKLREYNNHQEIRHLLEQDKAALCVHDEKNHHQDDYEYHQKRNENRQQFMKRMKLLRLSEMTEDLKQEQSVIEESILKLQAYLTQLKEEAQKFHESYHSSGSLRSNKIQEIKTEQKKRFGSNVLAAKSTKKTKIALIEKKVAQIKQERAEKRQQLLEERESRRRQKLAEKQRQQQDQRDAARTARHAERQDRKKESKPSLKMPHFRTITRRQTLTSEGTLFIITEVCSGDLEHPENNPVMNDPAKILKCADQMASTLARVHELGIIHMDVKPANMLYRRFPSKRQMREQEKLELQQVKQLEKSIVNDSNNEKKMHQLPVASIATAFNSRAPSHQQQQPAQNQSIKFTEDEDDSPELKKKRGRPPKKTTTQQQSKSKSNILTTLRPEQKKKGKSAPTSPKASQPTKIHKNNNNNHNSTTGAPSTNVGGLENSSCNNNVSVVQSALAQVQTIRRNNLTKQKNKNNNKSSSATIIKNKNPSHSLIEEIGTFEENTYSSSKHELQHHDRSSRATNQSASSAATSYRGGYFNASTSKANSQSQTAFAGTDSDENSNSMMSMLSWKNNKNNKNDDRDQDNFEDVDANKTNRDRQHEENDGDDDDDDDDDDLDVPQYLYYLSDFGNIQLVDPHDDEATTKAIGTYEYMDALCLEENICSRKTDSFSLGATLLQLLRNGKLLYECNETHEDGEAHGPECFVPLAKKATVPALKTLVNAIERQMMEHFVLEKQQNKAASGENNDDGEEIDYQGILDHHSLEQAKKKFGLNSVFREQMISEKVDAVRSIVCKLMNLNCSKRLFCSEAVQELAKVMKKLEEVKEKMKLKKKK